MVVVLTAPQPGGADKNMGPKKKHRWEWIAFQGRELELFFFFVWEEGAGGPYDDSHI